jgi:hypothetical protein
MGLSIRRDILYWIRRFENYDVDVKKREGWLGMVFLASKFVRASVSTGKEMIVEG